MKMIVALFRQPGLMRRALDELDTAGFSSDAWRVLASPNSAGIAALRAARELEPPGEFLDLGSYWGGQGAPDFPYEERRAVEERVAQGDTALQVVVADGAAADRVEAILRDAGVDRVLPGTIRDRAEGVEQWEPSRLANSRTGPAPTPR